MEEDALEAVVDWNGTTVEGVPELAGEGVPEVPKVEHQVAAAEEEALPVWLRQWVPSALSPAAVAAAPKVEGVEPLELLLLLLLRQLLLLQK